MDRNGCAKSGPTWPQSTGMMKRRNPRHVLERQKSFGGLAGPWRA
jgi:hypothetical protein